MSEMVSISFEASIALPIEELDACLGDAAWCVQKAIGPSTGAQVISAQADHVDDDDLLTDPDSPAVVSWDELADRELADADRRWPDDDERDSERRYQEDPW